VAWGPPDDFKEGVGSFVFFEIFFFALVWVCYFAVLCVDIQTWERKCIMANWLDWIGSMSESGLNKRIEKTTKEIDSLTKEIDSWTEIGEKTIPKEIAHIVGNPMEGVADELKAHRDEAKRRLTKLLKKKQEKEKLHDK
jgi:hypothetical protein